MLMITRNLSLYRLLATGPRSPITHGDAREVSSDTRRTAQRRGRDEFSGPPPKPARREASAYEVGDDKEVFWERGYVSFVACNRGNSGLAVQPVCLELKTFFADQ